MALNRSRFLNRKPKRGNAEPRKKPKPNNMTGTRPAGSILQKYREKRGYCGSFVCGISGARILGRRIWKGITGQENNSAEEDLQEFVQSALKSAATSGLSVAVTGAVTVAVKSGWLGTVLKNTPAGRIANAVCIGIENAKVLYKYATGEITAEEALDQAGSVTCSLVGDLSVGPRERA
jgi:hypothetical protein